MSGKKSSKPAKKLNASVVHVNGVGGSTKKPKGK